MDYDLPPPPLASSSQSEPTPMPAAPAPQSSGRVTADHIKTWVALYPAYFDRNLSRGSGRRVSKDLAYPNPDMQLLVEACRLALSGANPPLVFLPERKRHPQDPLRLGRLRVQLKGPDGKIVNPKIANKEDLLKAVAAKFVAAEETAERLRKSSEEFIRAQQEQQARMNVAQAQAAHKARGGAPMSLPAAMSAGGMMYQPSEGLKKAQTMPFANIPGARQEAAKAAVKGKGK